MPTKKKKYDEDVKTYTTKQLLQYKNQAKDYYIKNKGECSIKVLSRKAKVPQSMVRSWIKKEKWIDALVDEPGDVVVLSQKTKEVILNAGEEFKLTVQEELYCYHYMKTFNGTTAALRAGYSPAVCYQKSFVLQQDPRIISFIKHIKAQRNEEIMVESIDIINMYLKIAHTDMTDFASFKGYSVKLNSSKEVDGQMIQEVAETKGGVKIKLYDKKDALKELQKFVMPSEKRKIEIEEEKLNISKARLLMDIENSKKQTNSQEDLKILRKKMEERKKGKVK